MLQSMGSQRVGQDSRLPRGVRPRLEGKPRTPLSSRVATRLSWSPLSGLKGVQPPLPFGRPEDNCPLVASGSPDTNSCPSESGATFQLPTPVPRHPKEETGRQAPQLLLLGFKTRIPQAELFVR